MRTIDKIITKCDCKYGAPMGRHSSGSQEQAVWSGKKVFDCRVPMIDSYYDRGGAYWGSGGELRVRYTKDLTYVEFYRR